MDLSELKEQWKLGIVTPSEALQELGLLLVKYKNKPKLKEQVTLFINEVIGIPEELVFEDFSYGQD